MDPAAAIEEAASVRLRSVEAATARGDSAVQGFYRGAVVFLTGATGFLGKQLIEKLFRSCDIKRVYMLMREKKGQSVQHRLANMCQDPVFQVLRQRKPEFAERMRAVAGDITQLRLGIGDEDWQLLASEVNVIFHVAASVTFEEPLRVAVRTNVRAAVQALRLAQDCKSLRGYVHVSTAYSHATRGRIGGTVQDAFYDSPGDPHAIIDLVEQLSEDKLADIKPDMLKDWPNTYAFSKALGEEAVRTMAANLPACIVRPAIVISSNLEPSPGWVDPSNALGPSGLVLGIKMGVVHTLLARDGCRADLIPVDFVNNTIIAGAWAAAQRRAAGRRDVRIYTVSSARNPITIDEILTAMWDSQYKNVATPKASWYTFGLHTRFRLLFVVLTWLLHFGPAYIADAVLAMLRKKPKTMKFYRTAYNLASALSYYTCNEFHFRDDNLLALRASLSATDKEIYNFDIEKMSWDEQLALWIIGARKYILKDGLKNSMKGVKKQRMLRVVNYLVLGLYFYVIYKLFSSVAWFVWDLVTY